MMSRNNDGGDSDSDVAFASMDFMGVDFDDEYAGLFQESCRYRRSSKGGIIDGTQT